MKTSTLLTALALTLVTGAALGADSGPIAALLTTQDAAWNKHDPAALAGLFSKDATMVAPSGTRAEGLAAINALFASPGPTKTTTSSTHLDAVQWLGPDLAIIDATQTLGGTGPLAGATGKLVAVVKLVDGQWRFVAARP